MVCGESVYFAAMTTLRVISNGYGEDAIAAQLIQAIGLDALDIRIPLVGDGRSYVTLGLTPQLVQGVLPSGRFLRRFSMFFVIFDRDY